jgi:hypothetical protein
MPDEQKSGYVKEPDFLKKQVLSGILEEYDVVTRQRDQRKAALEGMEKHSQGKKSAYISFLSSEHLLILMTYPRSATF